MHEIYVALHITQQRYILFNNIIFFSKVFRHKEKTDMDTNSNSKKVMQRAPAKVQRKEFGENTNESTDDIAGDHGVKL